FKKRASKPSATSRSIKPARRRDLRHDRLRGGAWVRRLGHRPADDEIVGAVADRLGGRGDALLVDGRRALGPDAGRDEKHARANESAHRRRLDGARNEAIDAKRKRLFGAPPDRFDNAEPVAGVEKIGVVA